MIPSSRKQLSYVTLTYEKTMIAEQNATNVVHTDMYTYMMNLPNVSRPFDTPLGMFGKST
jgi:hypothetical protein